MRHTLITGASAGIGKAMAYSFASRGHNLILVARRLELLEAIQRDIAARHDVDVVVMQANLIHGAALNSLYDKCEEYDIETWINNAGFGDFSYAWDMDLQKAEDMLQLNINALTNLSLRYVRDYQDKDATLINVSSGAGYVIMKIAVTYCATKFYVSAFTEGLAHNLRDQGKKMRAKVLAPGATATEFVENAEKNATIKGADVFDPSVFATAEELGEYAYELYKSDKVVGTVNQKKELELKEPIFRSF